MHGLPADVAPAVTQYDPQRTREQLEALPTELIDGLRRRREERPLGCHFCGSYRHSGIVILLNGDLFRYCDDCASHAAARLTEGE